MSRFSSVWPRLVLDLSLDRSGLALVAEDALGVELSVLPTVAARVGASTLIVRAQARLRAGLGQLHLPWSKRNPRAMVPG